MMSITRLATAGDSWTGLFNHPLDLFLSLEGFGNQYVQFCLYRDYDGKVSPDEVASAAMYLKDTLGKEGIQELIQNLSKDKGHNAIYYISSIVSKPQLDFSVF